MVTDRALFEPEPLVLSFRYAVDNTRFCSSKVLPRTSLAAMAQLESIAAGQTANF